MCGFSDRRCSSCTLLFSGIEGALVVPYFSDEESTLPHAVDTSRLKHFNGIKIPVISNRKRVDILVG